MNYQQSKFLESSFTIKICGQVGNFTTHKDYYSSLYLPPAVHVTKFIHWGIYSKSLTLIFSRVREMITKPQHQF